MLYVGFALNVALVTVHVFHLTHRDRPAWDLFLLGISGATVAMLWPTVRRNLRS